MTEMSKLFGTWESYKSENLEEFFAKMGKPELCELMNKAPSKVTICQGPAADEVQQIMHFLNQTVVFKIGSTVQWDGGIGQLMDNLAEWDSGKFVVYMGEVGASNEDLKKSGKSCTREIISDDEHVLILQIGDVVAKRFYKRLPE